MHGLMARISPLRLSGMVPRKSVRFYRVVRGRREQLGSADVKVPARSGILWPLKPRMRFAVTFDGKQLYEVDDNALQNAGRVGIWTKADSVTRFDRREVSTSK